MRFYPSVPRGQSADSLETILLACEISCFRQTVGIEKKSVTLRQREPMDRKSCVAEHPQRHSRGILRRRSVTVDVKQRKMARAYKFHRTIARSSPYDESGELSGKSAFAEYAVGVFHHPIEWQTGLGEAAKRGMQVTHEHRRSDTLAGDVPDHEEQAAFCFKEVAVIAAHHPGGLIVVANAPACRRQTELRQESALDACGQGKVTLQGSLLRTRKVVEAEAHQRIGQQAFWFDGVVALVTKPECPLIDTA